MKIIRLDAAEWLSTDDVYADLLEGLGAPDWHGHNLNAVRDCLTGGLHRMKPPFTVEITGSHGSSSEIQLFLATVSDVFANARSEFDVDVLLRVR